MKEVAPLFQRFFAATSFAEATVVKKNAKVAKKWKKLATGCNGLFMQSQCDGGGALGKPSDPKTA